MTYWTRRTPERDGVYWWRRRAGHHAVIVEVCDGLVFYVARLIRRPAREMDGEWLGPLHAPAGEAVDRAPEPPHPDDEDDREPVRPADYRYYETPAVLGGG